MFSNSHQGFKAQVIKQFIGVGIFSRKKLHSAVNGSDNRGSGSRKFYLAIKSTVANYPKCHCKCRVKEISEVKPCSISTSWHNCYHRKRFYPEKIKLSIRVLEYICRYSFTPGCKFKNNIFGSTNRTILKPFTPGVFNAP